MVLAVASEWSKRKGLSDVIKISNSLGSDYQVVIVGADNRTDEILPDNIISIHRTQDQMELVKLYSAADCFINTTYEDNYPTVNLEAIACGTPVVTYDSGGSGEMVAENCGFVVQRGNIDGMVQAVKYCCLNKDNMKSDCIRKSDDFSQFDRFADYVEYYSMM